MSMKARYIQKKDTDKIDSYITYFSPNEKLQISQLQDEEKNLSNHYWYSYIRLKTKFRNWFQEVFLPQGYPHTVSSDYLQYQIWDSLQAYCSNLAGALSLHSTLVGIGVGQENASPLAAALSWLMKDGAGMVSSITFAYYKGSELDNNSKQWRLFADIANDGAHFVRLLAPVLPFPFLLTFCFSSVMSSLVGVAGGATRASLIQHQALCNNMADVSAKDGSQETLVNLAGLLTSLTLLPVLTSSPLITWTTFILFVILHLYTNFRAMRAIEMKTLNRPRMLHIFQSLTTSAFIPNVSSTNRNEPLFQGPAFIQNYLTNNFKLEIGVSLQYVVACMSNFEENFQQFFFLQNSNFLEEKYMLFLNNETKRIFIVYHEEAENSHILQSFWSAYLCAINLCDREELHNRICKEYIVEKEEDIPRFVLAVKKCARNTWEKITMQLLEKGWLLSPLRLRIGEWRLAESKFD